MKYMYTAYYKSILILNKLPWYNICFIVHLTSCKVLTDTAYDIQIPTFNLIDEKDGGTLYMYVHVWDMTTLFLPPMRTYTEKSQWKL